MDSFRTLLDAWWPPRKASTGSSSSGSGSATDRSGLLDQQVLGFICGCGHSGTSIVASHSEVHIPTVETAIFVQSPKTGSRQHKQYKQPRQNPDPEQDKREYQQVREDTLTASRRVVLEKTPMHLHAINLIREAVPGARFVIPVRNGRDVTASIARRYGDLQLGVDRWIQENTLVLAERNARDVFTFRYEDFIENPESVVQKICGFLELPFSRSLMDYHKQPRLWFNEAELRQGSGRGSTEHRALRNWQINQPIFDGRGRWKAEFGAKDLVELTEGRGRELMEVFGYL